MVKKIVAVWLFIVLFSCVFVITTEIAPPARAATITVDDSGGADHTTIQAAINVANEGDTIYVYSGVYYENLLIEKSLSLIGEDKNTVIINGSSSGKLIHLKADGVNITGFNLTYGDDGIFIDKSSNHNINNNIISQTKYYGVVLSYATNVMFMNNTLIKDGIIITGNVVSQYNTHMFENNTVNGLPIYYYKNVNGLTVPNDAGIIILANCQNCIVNHINFTEVDEAVILGYSDYNYISDNNMLSTYNNAIQLIFSSHNIIRGNNISQYDVGIYLVGSSYNNISGNNIQSSKIVSRGYGILFHGGSYNIINNNDVYLNTNQGLHLYDTNCNSILNNYIHHNNGAGIYLQSFCENNYLNSNNISLNTKGILLFLSDYNNVTENIVYFNNVCGINLSSSSNNYVYHNDIISNTKQSSDNMNNNFWDDGYPNGGNYWSDYGGIDLNSTPAQDVPPPDGIGDTPYNIDADSQDDYPLMEPIVLDTTPPQIISGPDVISISATSATIEWVTDEASDSVVEYGLTESYTDNVANNSFVTNHGITLTGLAPETLYHFRVKSKDSEGNEVISGDYTFTTSSVKPVQNIDKNTYYYGIQEAVDDADPGNTIFVSSGIYQEKVVIDKIINLTGADRNTTIIDGGGIGDVVRITADWVNISGFTANNSGSLVFPDYDAGVDLSNVQNCTLINNKFYDNNFGMLLSSSSNNVIKNNIATSNGMDGILMVSSTDNRIINNNGSSNNRDGLYLSASSNNNIADNIFNSNHQDGIYAYISTYNVLDNNELSLNHQHGIQISDSSNTTIISNYIYSNSNYGIYHYSSSNAILLDNEFLNDGVVIEGGLVNHYNSHTIPDNNLVNGKPLYYYKNCKDITIDGNSIEVGELILGNCSEMTIRNVHISGTDVGIEFGFTSNTTLKNCNSSFNNFHGIILLHSSYNNLEDNEIVWNSENGINLLEQSNNNNISMNGVSNNKYGIYLLRSSYINVSYNNIFYNSNGIVLETSLSNHNIIEKNNVSKNGGGIFLYWATNNNNIKHNTVWMNTFSGIALDWASNNNITGNDVSHGWNGIILTSPSVNNVIQGNSVSNNEKGISLISYLTNNNLIKANNVFSNNATNIDIQSSSDNMLVNNTISNSRHGILFSSSSNNIISSNNVFNHEYGINLSSSSNNRIYHNNFMDNLNQAFDDRDDNYWDDGYPSGGNYWSDYGGIDDFNGPNQDISGSDGIGDSSYSIDIGSLDNYPLMNPWGIDSILPIIELVWPSNNSFIKPGVIINFSISDENLDIVSYSVNEGSYQNLPLPYIIDTGDWGEGNYKIEVSAVDLSENINTTWFNFTIDSTPPSISLTSPENNSMISADPEILFSIADANLDQTTYSKNSGSPTPFPSPYTINTSSWPDGQYNITVYADDLAGNINEQWFTFTKDTSIPEISLNSPDNGSLLMEPTTLDFDVFDENLDVVQYLIGYASTIDFEEPYDIDTSGWEDGDYRITIYAIDLAGHQNEKWFIFRMDTATPSVISSSPQDGSSDVSAEPEIIIEFSESMDCDSVESAISIDPYIEHSCLWSNDNKTLTLNITEPLEYETYYRIVISTKAKDLAGKELENEYGFEFTTGAEPKDGDGDEFPVLILVLVIMAIVAAVIIVFLVTAKKKKVSEEAIPVTVEAPETIQVTCSNCSNLLSVNDIGTTMNVTCPFCSTLLTVQSQKVQIEQPQIQPQTQMQVQQPTIQISCPACKHVFAVTKTGGPTRVQCPNCGAAGTMNT